MPYSIVILGSGRFYNDSTLVHSFRYYDPEHSVSFNGKTRIITVELVKAEQVIDKPAQEMAAHEAWAAFFHYLTNRGKRSKINEILKTEGGIAMAGEALIHITQDERERAWRMSREKYILDTQSMRVKAKREGRAEGMTQAAQKMKALGFSDEQIQAVTGFSCEAVKTIE
jgi:predicted transposase/invertase (TIGR01784 family)